MTTGLKLIGLGLLILTLGACARGDPELMNIRQTEAGPDEFMILPGKPLETPPSYSELPRPIRPHQTGRMPRQKQVQVEAWGEILVDCVSTVLRLTQRFCHRRIALGAKQLFDRNWLRLILHSAKPTGACRWSNWRM